MNKFLSADFKYALIWLPICIALFNLLFYCLTIPAGIIFHVFPTIPTVGALVTWLALLPAFDNRWLFC